MIKDKQGLRRAYTTMLHKGATIELKQEIREYNHKKLGYEKIIYKTPKTIVTVIQFPGNVRTKKQAENAFKRTKLQRGFDNIFSTKSYKLFKRNKRWCAYHTLSVTF